MVSFPVLPSAVASTTLAGSGYESLTRNLGHTYRTRGGVVGTIVGASAGIEAADTDAIIELELAVFLSVIFIDCPASCGSITHQTLLYTGAYGRSRRLSQPGIY